VSVWGDAIGDVGQQMSLERLRALLQRRKAIDASGGEDITKCPTTGVEKRYPLPRTVLVYEVKEVEGQPYKLCQRSQLDDECSHHWGSHIDYRGIEQIPDEWQ